MQTLGERYDWRMILISPVPTRKLQGNAANVRSEPITVFFCVAAKVWFLKKKVNCFRIQKTTNVTLRRQDCIVASTLGSEFSGS